MNKLLNEQLNELLANSPGSITRLGWEGALRVAAGTLCRAARGEITATTVLCDLQGADFDTFEFLAQDIADEYGLDVSIRQLPCWLSVRFTWPRLEAMPIETGRADKSVLARLLRR